MMFKKKLLASAMATALVTGAMVSGGAQAIRMSETGDGQVLMGPLYMAMAQTSAGAVYNTTRVKVVNSSLTNAVKAKIVFRSKKHSDECFDAILYLTPGDVAYMDVNVDPANANNATVWSDDDSLLASRTTSATDVKFASQVAGGVTWTMTAPRTEPAADSCAMGHIEVIGAYAAAGTVTVATGSPVVVKQGMSKFDLLRIFDSTKSFLNANNTVTQITNVAVGQGADHATRVQLKGQTVISKTDGSDRISIPMVALRNGTTPNVAVSNDTVINNPSFDVFVGQETAMGLNFITGTSSDALVDIENALATGTLYGFYENSNTSMVGSGIGMGMTMPTKYRHEVNQYTSSWSYNPPYDTKGKFMYGSSLFDNQENSAPVSVSPVCVVSPCPVTVVTPGTLDQEVNYFALTGTTTWKPTSGWVNVSVSAATTGATDYTAGFGLPTIGFLHYYTDAVTRSVVDTMSR
jgi:hypothetical protein